MIEQNYSGIILLKSVQRDWKPWPVIEKLLFIQWLELTGLEQISIMYLTQKSETDNMLEDINTTNTVQMNNVWYH